MTTSASTGTSAAGVNRNRVVTSHAVMKVTISCMGHLQQKKSDETAHQQYQDREPKQARQHPSEASLFVELRACQPYLVMVVLVFLPRTPRTPSRSFAGKRETLLAFRALDSGAALLIPEWNQFPAMWTGCARHGGAKQE